MNIDDLKTYRAQPVGIGKKHQASVLIPLIEKEDGTHLLFQVRSAKLNHQPGDVCFPGGGREDDESPSETAVREVCEELLVNPEQIDLIGPSDWLNENSLTIYPFVGRLRDYNYTYSTDEVSEVFTVPLDFFRNTEPERYKIKANLEFPDDFPFDRIWGGRDYQWHSRAEEVLFWEYEGHIIWGLTARILMGFLEILHRGE